MLVTIQSRYLRFRVSYKKYRASSRSNLKRSKIDLRIHDSFVRNPRQMDVAWPGLYFGIALITMDVIIFGKGRREKEKTRRRSPLSLRERILVPLENFNWHFYNLCTALSPVFFCIAELTRARQCLLMKQSIYRS